MASRSEAQKARREREAAAKVSLARTAAAATVRAKRAETNDGVLGPVPRSRRARNAHPSEQGQTTGEPFQYDGGSWGVDFRLYSRNSVHGGWPRRPTIRGPVVGNVRIDDGSIERN